MGNLKRITLLMLTVTCGVFLSACGSGEGAGSEDTGQDVVPIETLQGNLEDIIYESNGESVADVTFDNETKQVIITYSVETSDELRKASVMYILGETVMQSGGIPEGYEETGTNIEQLTEMYTGLLEGIESSSDTLVDTLATGGHPGYIIVYTMDSSEGITDILTTYKDGKFSRIYEDVLRNRLKEGTE